MTAIAITKIFSPVGMAPQHTSSVVVVARTSCTRDGEGGRSKQQQQI